MSESAPEPENPYTSEAEMASADAPPADLPTPQPRRPVVAIVIGVLLLLSSLILLGIRVFEIARVISMGSQENTEVYINPIVYVGWSQDLLTMLTACVGGVGLIIGARFGWWVSMFHGYWRIVVQGLMPLVSVLLADVTYEIPLLPLLKSLLLLSAIFGLMILYLRRRKVMLFYHVAAARTLLTDLCLLALAVLLAFCFQIVGDFMHEEQRIASPPGHNQETSPHDLSLIDASALWCASTSS